MPNNSDLKRWYKKTKVEKNDFVRRDADDDSEDKTMATEEYVDNAIASAITKTLNTEVWDE